MEDNYAVSKAVLGIRHLLRYLEDGLTQNFDVVSKSIDEVELWCLITHFSNNMDSFYDTIPDYILENIFKMVPVDDRSATELFGTGFKSNSDLSYKDQFRWIRNGLSHGKFSYSNGIINLINGEYQATFDLLWLEKLVGTTLKNDHFDFRKGMSYCSVSSAVNPFEVKNSDFEDLCRRGIVQFTKITLLTSNKDTILELLKLSDFPKERLSFSYFTSFIEGLLQQCELDPYNTPEMNLSKIKNCHREIEEGFKNKVRVETLPLNISDELLKDPEFLDLNFFDKCNYLIVKSKCSGSPTTYNFEVINNLIFLFEQIKSGNYGKLQLFFLKDSVDFLLKVYTNIFFNIFGDVDSYPVAERYGVRCANVYASKIYKEYLKLLRKNHEDVIKFKGPKFILNAVLNGMTSYSKLLDESFGDASLNFSWKMRNSLMHNHIEFDGENVRFFTTGSRLFIWKYNRKKETWEKKEYKNVKPLWEAVMSKANLLSMIDELFTMNGILIKFDLSESHTLKDN